jgi:hypothetical protein
MDWAVGIQNLDTAARGGIHRVLARDGVGWTGRQTEKGECDGRTYLQERTEAKSKRNMK